MDELGVDTIGITHRGQRYLANRCQRTQPDLRRFLFSGFMADICRATLGEKAYFFFDQFVVKGPDGGLPFGWHQDSGYVVGNGGPPVHRFYLTGALPDRGVIAPPDVVGVLDDDGVEFLGGVVGLKLDGANVEGAEAGDVPEIPPPPDAPEPPLAWALMVGAPKTNTALTITNRDCLCE